MTTNLNWRASAAPIAASLAVLIAASAGAMPPMGDWSQPENIEALPNSSPEMNTPGVDGCASQSRDGLMLAFNSSRAGNQEIFIATRASTDVGFDAPVRLGAAINTDALEFCPTLLPGKRMIFSRASESDPGDLYETRHGPKGWSQPRSLGPNINSGLMDEAASVYEDEQGNEVMVFSRRPGSGPGGKIYQSVNGGQAELVQGGPHSSFADNRPSVTHDGRTIFWDSTRTGSQGPDIWYATRSSTSQAWGQARHLSDISSDALDMRPSVSWDGTMLTFSSNRMPGSTSLAPDMWFVTRSR